MQTPSQEPTLEQVFGDFLEQVEAQVPADIEQYCRLHPLLANELRRMHVRWQAMTRAFEELSLPASDDAGPATASSIDVLMARLAARGVGMARYAVGSEVARGAMGRVVRAWDEDLRREVALKVQRGSGDDARMRRRFLEEAQIAAQLEHPGIVPIHELGVDESGRPFFSMQLVQGKHLGEILTLAQSESDGWTRTRVIGVLVRVCEAVAFAHSRGVVHRDLKPANIMVGRFGEVYVMDWGLARVQGEAASGDDGSELDTLSYEVRAEDDSSPLLTLHGDVVGTPAYMAPEQAAGDACVASPAVDVYALGCILYHLLAGQMPYGEVGGRNVEQLLQQVQNEGPRELPQTVPGELRSICARAMARDPAQRYAGAAEFGDDLRAFLEVRTVRAHATGRFADLQKWVARNRALAISCAALFLSVMLGAIVVTALWLRADRDRARADAGAALLQTEIDRSAFRTSRQALQLDDSIEAGEVMWRAHFAGRMPRATGWALVELSERDPYLVTLPVHDGRPVAFAPAVHAVLVADSDGRVQVREPDTLVLRHEVGTPGSAITSLAAMPDQPFAVVGNADGELIVIDLVTGGERWREKVHDGAVRCVATAAGGLIVTGGADGRVMRESLAERQPQLVRQHGAAIGALVVTPGGDGAMAGDVNGRIDGDAFVGGWHVERNLGANVTALVFGEHQNELWAGSTDHRLRFFDFDDARRDRNLPTANGTCRQLARDQDGSILVGGWWRISRFAADGTSKPLALRGSTKLDLDRVHHRLVTSGTACGLGIVDTSRRGEQLLPGVQMVLSADGRRLATEVAGRVVVRDVDRGEVVGSLPPGSTGSLAFGPHGERVAVSSDQHVQVFDVDRGARLFVCDGPAEDPFGACCSFSPDGDELAVCVGSTVVRRLRSRDGQVVAEYRYPGSRATRVVWAADGSRLAVIGRTDDSVRIYHLADGKREDVAFDCSLPMGVKTSLSSVALSPDNSEVAVGMWNGAVMVRKPDGSTATIAAHEGSVWSLQFADNDPGLLVTAGGASGVRFWDLDTLECCYHPVHSSVIGATMSDDGRTLACHSSDGVRLIDLTYWRRHIAGNLDYQLERQRHRMAIDPVREAALRAWAADVMKEAWPRW